MSFDELGGLGSIAGDEYGGKGLLDFRRDEEANMLKKKVQDYQESQQRQQQLVQKLQAKVSKISNSFN